MIIKLHKEYPCGFGKPAIDKIDSNIFIYRYFGKCFECNYCKDECCNHGVDIDITNVERLLKIKDELEKFVQIPANEWFISNYIPDSEFPGGKYTRTNTKNGKCVFIDTKNRGCLIHKYCIIQNIDFHELKPIVSCLFPLTFDNGLLHPMDEIEEQNFVCMEGIMNLYRGVRNDLKYYFGEELIELLDNLENQTINDNF